MIKEKVNFFNPSGLNEQFVFRPKLSEAKQSKIKIRDIMTLSSATSIQLMMATNSIFSELDYAVRDRERKRDKSICQNLMTGFRKC
jgi:hypothetical protein